MRCVWLISNFRKSISKRTTSNTGANFKTGQTVTAIGIQNGDTLNAVAGITNNLMENEHDRETAIAQGGVPGLGTSVFSIIFSFIPLLAGVVLLFTSGTRKP